MARRKLTADQIATSAKLLGVPPALALAIWDQESGQGTNTKTSSRGAVGDFQIMPATFKQYGNGDINDSIDNMNAGLNYLGSLLKRYNNDWGKVAQAYYHGSALPPGTRGPTSGSGTPDVATYGQQILDKANRFAAKGFGGPSLASLATAPAGATSTARIPDLYGNAMGTAPIPRGARTVGGITRPQIGPSGSLIDPGFSRMSGGGDLGNLGPSAEQTGGYGGGPDDQTLMTQSGNEYDVDNFIRKMVDEIV